MNSVVPLLTVRTGTGVASATPAAVTTAATSATRALFLPDTLQLIKVDRALVVVDRRADHRGLQHEVVRGSVDLHQIGFVVEHRRKDRLCERRVEARMHDQKICDSRYGHVD